MVFVMIVVVLVVWHHRIWSDLWPLDKSIVGPNLFAALIQGAVVLIVVVLVWQPVRRRLHLFMDRKIDTLQGSIVKFHKRSEEHRDLLHRDSSEGRAVLEAKLDHVIRYHPDIPEFGEEGTPRTD